MKSLYMICILIGLVLCENQPAQPVQQIQPLVKVVPAEAVVKQAPAMASLDESANSNAVNSVPETLVGELKAVPAVADERENILRQDTDEGRQIKLNPIPLVLPSILSNPFIQKLMNPFGDSQSQAVQQVAGDDQNKQEAQGEEKPHKILTILVMNRFRPSNFNPFNPFGNIDDSASSLDSSDNKLLGNPNENPNADSDNDDDDESDDFGVKTVNLLGGKKDIDNKAFNFVNSEKHLLGGDDDVDKLRFPPMILTGNEDAKMNELNRPDQRPPIVVQSIMNMMDRIKDIFNQDPFFKPDVQQMQGQFSIDSPFIVKTDDGANAYISNDIGANPPPPAGQDSNVKKCMMMNFMRLKASIYYRTIVHLLFFSGILLFILFMALLTVKTFNRRRQLRYQNNMNIATINSLISEEGNSQKLKEVEANQANQDQRKSSRFYFFRLGNLRSTNAYQGLNADSSFLLPQAPPAYDQVIIRDKPVSIEHHQPVKSKLSSSLVSSLANAYKYRLFSNQESSTSGQINDTEDRKSLSSLPDYEQSTSKLTPQEEEKDQKPAEN